MKKAGSCPTKKQESADCFAFLGVASLLGSSLALDSLLPRGANGEGMGDKGYQLTSDAPKKHEKGGRLSNQETDARRCVRF